MISAEWEKILCEGILFISYILICGGLTRSRFSKTVTMLAAGGTISVVVLIQAALLVSGQDLTLVLTLLPLTAYLPVIICVHFLSRSGFFQTMAVWTVGVIVYFVLKMFRKLFVQNLAVRTGLSGWNGNLLTTVCLLLAAGLMIFLVFRFLRRPFQTYVAENHTNWLLLSFPVLMVFLLFSYVGNSTTDDTLLILLFLTACSIFLVLVRVLTSATAIARLKASEREVSRQVQMQRQEYENICKKLELGRTYRHDMRHHLMALEGLAKQGDTEAMTRYIENLNGRFTDMEKTTYCENSTVNAVVAACIRKAEEANCTITAKVNLPREIPFDVTHVCVILANALENAVNACEKIQPEEKRHICLTVELIDNRKLAIAIENPCDTPVSFDADGFPDVPKREGHGIGLKSIHAVAKMYRGFFQCECREGKFCFKAVLFTCQNSVVPPVGKNVGNKKMRKRLASSALFSMLAFFMLINCMPVMAQTLADLPGLGLLVQIADLRSYHSQWGIRRLMRFFQC